MNAGTGIAGYTRGAAPSSLWIDGPGNRICTGAVVASLILMELIRAGTDRAGPNALGRTRDRLVLDQSSSVGNECTDNGPA